MFLLTKEVTGYADMIVPILALMVAIVLSGFLWYIVRSGSIWLGLKARGYAEREEVYLNGAPAVITKLGLMTTTFLILNGGGAVIRWASVSNVSMDSQKIQRVSLRLSLLDHTESKSDSPSPSPKP